ncbi:aldehyde dehydrogenase family protein [Sedimentibacter sp. zth1]|uniref:aldehyde dehydrogenase family protein n=1 Tax=Sedimentibacter sp. zth1 TaxID=2816908 RepID=UPI001A934BD0|nr:aldehyde dehydrogenase family protein [Sedimentibacter sp. zth1]QSX05614.1 aldehyde dehydrogenase family protein [Sedimentibacter sp. zth1]
MNIFDNDLLSIQEARILVENAHEAQIRLSSFTQEKLDKIVNAMINAVESNLKELAEVSYQETEYGKASDKIIKGKLICCHLKEELNKLRCVGVISEDKVNKTMDIGVPVGVITAFCPSTSPVTTTLYKAAIAVKSGNAIIFSPHMKAKKSMSKTLELIISVAEEAGLPEGAISYLHTVSKSGSIELINHKYTTMIMNTGVPGMLDECYKSGKPVIYGGAGHGPAFIEKTADINRAAKDIIDSKSFDYGVMAGSEQCVVVDSSIAKEVQYAMKSNGAYFMSEEESNKLGQLFFTKDGSIERNLVGKSPQFLAKLAGFAVDSSVKVLVSKQKYVSYDNPYSKEKFSPVLAYYIEADWLHACEKCIELLLTERQGHTLVIHSNDEQVIRLFALKKPVGRVLVNTPAAFGSMGVTANLFPAMTLGSGSVGKGMTSDNVSPLNLVYVRKVGYGVREINLDCGCENNLEYQIENYEASEKGSASRTNIVQEEREEKTIDIEFLNQVVEKLLRDK